MGEMVVGYDGSDCAKGALAEAVTLANETGDSLVIVFGFAPPSVRSGGPVGYQRDAIEEIATARLAEAMDAVAGSGVTAETLAVEALPVDALIETAATRGAGMIVVGSRGESPLKGVIIGSTSYKLLHRSSIPVLVVPAAE